MDSTTSRNIIMAVLVLAIAVAVFYMIDPTMGGILKNASGFMNYENFADAQNPAILHANTATSGAMKREMFENAAGNLMATNSNEHLANNSANVSPSTPESEGFANLEPSPMPFPEADKPGNCYPKNQLTPGELLPNDPNSKWAQVNPMGQGDISGKNFLSAGALVGVNTVGQSLRNANLQLRSEPPCPQVQVGPWMQTTIEPDLQRRPLEGY
jgi:hypothetical protein